MAEKKKDARKSVVEALQPRSIRLFNYHECVQYSFKFRSSQWQMIINDDPYVVYYVWYVLENRTRDLEAIYIWGIQSFVLRANCVSSNKNVSLEESNPVISGSSSQPSRKILTTKTLTLTRLRSRKSHQAWKNYSTCGWKKWWYPCKLNMGTK